MKTPCATRSLPLDLENVEHVRTYTKHPQMNRIWMYLLWIINIEFHLKRVPLQATAFDRGVGNGGDEFAPTHCISVVRLSVNSAWAKIWHSGYDGINLCRSPGATTVILAACFNYRELVGPFLFR